MVAPRSLHRGAVLLAVLTLLLVGCGEQSKVPADAPVRITGTVLDPTGQPLTDRPVHLYGGLAGADVAFAAFTLGLGCLDGACHGTTKDASTGSRGDYAFSLLGQDTRSAFGSVRSQVVATSAAPAQGQSSGAGVSATFVVQTRAVSLPPLHLVDPRLAVQGDSRRVVARWGTRQPGPYTLVFAGDDGRPVWRQTTAGQALAVDGRVLEGTTGEVALTGGSKDRITGSDLTVLWRSAGYGYASSAGAPASRGAACTLGATVPATCPLTDGDLLGTAAPRTTCPSPSPRPASCATATITLAAPTPADLVVVRGCVPSCPVEVSADGRAFRPAGTASSEFSALPLDGRPVRAVRVGTGSGVREVSVWEPTKAAAALLPPRPGSPVAAPGARSLWPLLLGGGLLLALAVAVTWQIARRPRKAG